MNIWTKLGISVALVAFCCIGIGEFLQPTWFYERHRWSICAGLIVSGMVVGGSGMYVLRRIRGRYLETQAELPQEDRDTDGKGWEPFLLFNPAYWGVMTVIFGIIIVFFVPTHSKRAKAQVAARVPPAPRKPQTPPPAPVKTNQAANPPARVEIPRFHLQGITLREGQPSALIDGRTYFVGDGVGDAKVISIDSEVVLLQWREIKVVLRAPR